MTHPSLPLVSNWTHEIQEIVSEDPTALLRILVKLDGIVSLQTDNPYLQRKIDFLAFELQSKCEGYSDADKVVLLNDFFFDEKKFTLSQDLKLDYSHFLLRNLFIQKSAAPVLMSIFYRYLAHQIDLPIYLVQVEPYTMVKWLDKDQSHYMDLSRKGQKFTPPELLEFLNGYQNLDPGTLEILPNKSILMVYLDKIIACLKQVDLDALYKICLDLYIEADSSNLLLLGERGLLNYKMGEMGSALEDLRRYFSFIDFSSAPRPVKKTYSRLLDLHRCKSIEQNVDWLH